MTIIGDGDASLMATLIERGPYWARDIQKITCANHVMKNVRIGLEELVKSNKCYGGRGRFTQKQRSRLVIGLRSAIRMRSNQFKVHGNRSLALSEMRKDIINAPYHIFGKHDHCSKDFCKFEEKENETEEDVISDGISTSDDVEADVVGGVLDEQVEAWAEGNASSAYVAKGKDVTDQLPNGLINDIQCLTQKKLLTKLEQLLGNFTSNLAECWMSIRTKFDGGKRINRCTGSSWNSRCAGASLRFQFGPMWSSQVWQDVFKEKPTPSLVFLGQKNEKQREHSKKYKSSQKGLKRRKVWKSIKGKAAKQDQSLYGPDAVQVETDITPDELKRSCDIYLQKYKVPDEQIQIIEQDTRGQSSNDRWFQERKNRLTASNFHPILSRQYNKHKWTPLVKQLLYSANFLDSIDCQYGREQESPSIVDYIKKRKVDDNIDVSVKESGLVIMPSSPFLAASPDGIVFENGCEGLLEIKNLSKFRSLRIYEAIDRAKKEKKVFPLEVVNGIKRLKKRNPHYTQIQGQLLVTGKNWCDYILRTQVDCHIERITADKEFHERLHKRLNYFFMNCLLPEIALPRHNRGGIREPLIPLES